MKKRVSSCQKCHWMWRRDALYRWCSAMFSHFYWNIRRCTWIHLPFITCDTNSSFWQLKKKRQKNVAERRAFFIRCYWFKFTTSIDLMSAWVYFFFRRRRQRQHSTLYLEASLTRKKQYICINIPCVQRQMKIPNWWILKRRILEMNSCAVFTQKCAFIETWYNERLFINNSSFQAGDSQGVSFFNPFIFSKFTTFHWNIAIDRKRLYRFSLTSLCRAEVLELRVLLKRRFAFAAIVIDFFALCEH